ncbi:MAG TPA: hypothetical protein VN611_05370 [Patescibacteria group bacterium]|nr:hypothetical protein [Patescibacteria group bacterium]
MRETITINRITPCPILGREVAQQISAYAIPGEDKRTKSELLTAYCSGGDVCKTPDCQFLAGLSGKAYTKTLAGIYQFIDNV